MKRHAILAAAILASASPVFGQVAVGSKAPDITAGVWYNLPGGMKKLTLADLKGSIVMVEFWATW